MASYGRLQPQEGKHLLFLNRVSKVMDMDNYENMILLGDFNLSVTENTIHVFCEMHSLQNLINEPTCYKMLTTHHL